jgi:hypothetical protein
MRRTRWIAALALTVALAAAPEALSRQRIMRPGGQPGAGGVINLPIQEQDGNGNVWMIQQGGWFQQHGNMPLYSQGGMFMVGTGQMAQQDNNQCRKDEKTGEYIFENLRINDISFTRRVKIDPATGMLRMIDVFKNTTAREQKIEYMLQSMYNYNPMSSGPVEDPRKKGRPLGWVGTTGNQGWRSVVEVYNGKRSKLNTNSKFMKGDNYTWGSYLVPVPAGQEMAIMHLHGTAASTEAGQEFINSLDDRKILKDVPKEIRKLIVNFRGGDSASVGDLELLRGEMFDVIELSSGDQFKGTLKEPSYKLQTPEGPVDVPADKVLGMFSIGQFKPRQLVFTIDGQVIGGELAKPVIEMQLTSGQLTKVPLSQLTRLGYRRRAGEPEEYVFEKPYVTLRSGERLFLKMPEQPIGFVSRYGTLSVDPKAIASISFQSDQHGVHELALTDGTVLAGLFVGDQITAIRDGATEPMKLDAAKLLRWQFKNIEDPDDSGAFMETTTGDRFAGSLDGKLHVETAFDSLEIAGEQVAALERVKESPTDVQIKLWDSAVVSGRMVETQLPMKLASGVVVKVPVSAVKEYQQPTPKPSATVLEQIGTLVKQLNADDAKDRDAAEQQLISFGANVGPVLTELRAKQPPEAQQRIDTILKALNAEKPAPAANPQPQPMPFAID